MEKAGKINLKFIEENENLVIEEKLNVEHLTMDQILKQNKNLKNFDKPNQTNTSSHEENNLENRRKTLEDCKKNSDSVPVKFYDKASSASTSPTSREEEDLRRRSDVDV